MPADPSRWALCDPDGTVVNVVLWCPSDDVDFGDGLTPVEADEGTNIGDTIDLPEPESV